MCVEAGVPSQYMLLVHKCDMYATAMEASSSLISRSPMGIDVTNDVPQASEEPDVYSMVHTLAQQY